jgi:hypothetical protein
LLLTIWHIISGGWNTLANIVFALPTAEGRNDAQSLLFENILHSSTKIEKNLITASLLTIKKPK